MVMDALMAGYTVANSVTLLSCLPKKKRKERKNRSVQDAERHRDWENKHFNG